MLEAIVIVIIILAAASLSLALWRWSHTRADERAWRTLALTPAARNGVFDPAMVAGLPDPARRYFAYMIAPGTPLNAAVTLKMQGDLGFGDKSKPGYRPFTAEQILAPPYGFVWRLKAGAIGGSDGATPETSWTRFWLFGLVPVVRVSGDPDHRRSAFGRLVAEAAFWAPASLLPAEHVRWQEAGADTARAVVAHGGLEQAVDITLAADGQPSTVLIQRWSDVNADKTYRLQPFGGSLSGFREFGGYRLPTRIEGGNHFGTEDYFAFFKAEITDIRPAVER